MPKFVGNRESLTRLRVKGVDPDYDAPIFLKEEAGEVAFIGDKAQLGTAQPRKSLDGNRRLRHLTQLQQGVRCFPDLLTMHRPRRRAHDVTSSLALLDLP